MAVTADHIREKLTKELEAVHVVGFILSDCECSTNIYALLNQLSNRRRLNNRCLRNWIGVQIFYCVVYIAVCVVVRSSVCNI